MKKTPVRTRPKTVHARMRKNKGKHMRERQETAGGIEGPVRMCVICRRRFAKAQLTRHVLTAQRILTIDAEKTKPGRGWYLCSDAACMAKFAKFRPGTRRKGG